MSRRILQRSFLLVLIVCLTGWIAPASAQEGGLLKGRATGLGKVGKKRVRVQLKGEIQADRTAGDFSRSAIWLRSVLAEGDEELLDVEMPILLEPRARVGRRSATYSAQADSGARIKLKLKKKRKKTRRAGTSEPFDGDDLKFVLSVRGAGGMEPAACGQGAETVRLTTHFSFQDGEGSPVDFDRDWIWRCGRKLHALEEAPLLVDDAPPSPPSVAEICADDATIALNPDLAKQFPMMAACYSDVSSEFRKLPWPLFWNNGGPNINYQLEAETAGYLRGAACLAKKSCSAITTVNFQDLTDFTYANPWPGTASGPTGQPTLLTQCLANHVASTESSAVKSEIYLAIYCYEQPGVTPKPCGYENIIDKYSDELGIDSTDSDVVKMLKVIFGTIKKINGEGGAQISGVTAQEKGTFISSDPEFQDNWVPLSQEILGYTLPYAPYGGGGELPPPDPSSKLAAIERTSLQPLYANWEEPIDGTPRPNQDTCAMPGEAPPYSEQGADYTSSFFRCGLKHPGGDDLPAQDSCLDATTMFNTYYPEWYNWASGKGYQSKNLQDQIKSITQFPSDSYDRLIWEFSLEQNWKRVKDACIGMFYNQDCSCGEPNDLGILPVVDTVEWFWAVHDYAQAAAAEAGVSMDKPQYSGLYQLDLIPAHFLTDQTEALMPSWMEYVPFKQCVDSLYDGTPPVFKTWYEGLCGEGIPNANSLDKPCTCNVDFVNPYPNVPDSPYECAQSYDPSAS